METMSHIIAKRRSVRSFNGEPLSSEDRKLVAELVEHTGNPFGVPVEFRVLNAQKHGLKSPVITGEEFYVAAKVKRMKNFELALGYEFERFCLDAAAAGLGTVMLAASLNREAFERVMEVGEDEVMPVASPIGHEASKQSIRERAMRKALGADNRLAFGEVFFDEAFDRPLTEERAGAIRDALEAVRWAPSATNKQPWRVIVDGNQVHFFENRTIKESPLGDIQKVDMGITLVHFDLVAKEAGFDVHIAQAAPQIEAPESWKYISTCEIA